MSFFALPVELIDHICSYCDLSQIKNLRNTCKCIQEVADGHMFDEILAYMTQDSMNDAKAVANHPVFRKRPRVLWVQGEMLEQLSYRKWRKQVDRGIEWKAWPGYAKPDHVNELDYRLRETQAIADRISRRAPHSSSLREAMTAASSLFPGSDWTELQLHVRFGIYCTLINESLKMLCANNGEPESLMCRSLGDVFEKCTALEEVHFTMAHAIRVSTTKHNMTFHSGLVLPHGDPETYNNGTFGVRELVCAAHRSRYSPKVLRLGSVSHNICMQDIEDELESFLRNVEVLEWVLATPYLDENLNVDEDELIEISSQFDAGMFITGFINFAPRLRCIELEMPFGMPDSAFPDLAGVVGELTFANLETFSISAITASNHDLVDFLLRHSATLKEVQLGEVTINGSSWPECLAAVAGKLQHLKSFELRGRFATEEQEMWYWFGHLDKGKGRGNRYGYRLSKYVISGGGPCPQPPESPDGTEDEWNSDDEQEAAEEAEWSDEDDEHDTSSVERE